MLTENQKPANCIFNLSVHFLKCKHSIKLLPSCMYTTSSTTVPVLLSVPRLCLNTVCHFFAKCVCIFSCVFCTLLSASTTWLSPPSHFCERGWQGWGKHIIKKHCCPPQGKTRPASPYGVSSACQSGLPWCYLQLFLLSPLPLELYMCNFLNTRNGNSLSW